MVGEGSCGEPCAVTSQLIELTDVIPKPVLSVRFSLPLQNG